MTKTVATDLLQIGYLESGPPDGPPVILLHGFPDDVHAYDAVAPQLAKAGRRVLVPYLRGYGPTRFRASETMRSGQQAAIGQDLVAFATALGIGQFTAVGYDWGGRAAAIAAVLAPERVRGLVLCGGYTIHNAAGPSRPQSAEQELAYWYQWYFATERGRQGLALNRGPLCRLMWQKWSPTWAFTEAEYATAAKSFDNPDFVDVVIHSYRHRHGWAAGDPRYEAVEQRLAQRPKIAAPTVVLHGTADEVGPPQGSEGNSALFTGRYSRILVPGVGHFIPREAPQAVIEATLGLP